jgi:hypothetical protein
MAGEPFAMSIGGAEKQVAHDGPRYRYTRFMPSRPYQPGVGQGVEEGRWPNKEEK